MIIAGELINASRNTVHAALEARDRVPIQAIAEEKWKAGEDFIDLNVGVFVEQEEECLKWLAMTAQEAVNIPCFIDSPNPRAIEAALKVYRGPVMIDSISLERGRYADILSLIAGTDLKVVALCMSDNGIPQTGVERLSIVENLING